MAQIFHPSTNTISRVSLFGALFFLAFLAWVVGAVYRSPYVTRQYAPIEQPVPFSHKHHVTDDGIDCRYCHTSVETSSFAGIPPTKTCMNCHSIIWRDAPILQPVRDSYRTGEPIKWERVDFVPEFVFFNHSIHIHKGVGCTTCHGPVGDMPLTWQATSMHMRWCVDCHRQPAEQLRPRSEVFNVNWQPPPNQAEWGEQLMKDYNVKSLIDCYTCHR
ncbi:MAG TPA: cytochrome c3 family protein [Verrucomicrobiae bacterium]|nr:cytochrome c3 family protein [Verrucomicrobiae bacterium]